MSNALAIAGVTATLEYCLNLVFNSPTAALGSVSVSALAPDLVQTNMGTGSNAQLHVNLFLHQVSQNTAWRNLGYPSISSDGATALRNPPLALDLHYLLTVYASEDGQAEALLGYAIQMLHENSILPRALIQAAISGLPTTNPLAGVLGSSGLADQAEMIKIVPSALNREEMAWIWTALKADYRPTFPFQVSVVLIDSHYIPTVGLPVLSQNISVQAGTPPQIYEVQPPNQQIAVGPGDIVTLTGTSLAGAAQGGVQVALVNSRLGIQWPPFAPASVNTNAVTFVVPDQPAGVPAGVYTVALLFANSTGAVASSTNTLPMPLAPEILTAPAATATANTAGTLVALSCKPQVLPNQSVSLILGSNSAAAVPFTAATAALTFQFPKLASGSYLARLRVDGVESPIQVNWTATPPVFTGPFVTI
jgi:hypothetical protein